MFPTKAVTLPGGQLGTLSGQYEAVSPPIHNAPPDAVIGRKWMGDAERRAITLKVLTSRLTEAWGRAMATGRSERMLNFIFFIAGEFVFFFFSDEWF